MPSPLSETPCYKPLCSHEFFKSTAKIVWKGSASKLTNKKEAKNLLFGYTRYHCLHMGTPGKHPPSRQTLGREEEPDGGSTWGSVPSFKADSPGQLDKELHLITGHCLPWLASSPEGGCKASNSSFDIGAPATNKAPLFLNV